MFQSGFKLRLTLVTTIVGLVLLTTFAIGGSAAYLTLRNTHQLIDQSRTAAVSGATGEMRALFEKAPRIAYELFNAAYRGALPLDNERELVALFAERLRLEPQLAWIGFGDNGTGKYVGASRRLYGTNEIVEYIADPVVDGALPQQHAVAPDGTRSKPTFEETKPYFVVTKQWFKDAMAATEDILWSAPYKFETGGLGITASKVLRLADQEQPKGAFHVDLRLEAISGYLTDLKVGDHGAVFLVGRAGRRIVSPMGDQVPAAEAALDAAALRQPLHFGGVPELVTTGGRSYEVVFAPVDVAGNLGMAIAVVVDLADITDGVYRASAFAALIGLVAALVAIILGVLLSSRIARPITAIASDLADVGAFRITRGLSPQSFVREVSDLGRSVDGMKASLRSFSRYVPTDLVRALLAAGREAELGGEVRRLTIHFSDVENFTTISEAMEPKELVEAVGRYFDVMTAALTGHGGTVDKFMGDGILAFFNAPNELPDHPRHACHAALAAQEALRVLAGEARAKGGPVFHARIGLGLGDVLVGNIGTHERFAYTVIGDEVNLASRVEGLNKIYGTAIMATDMLVAETGRTFEWRRLDRVAVKGRQKGTLVYELLGVVGSVPADRLAARDSYEKALECYFAARFAVAATLFDAAAAARPDDLAARTMGNRSRELAAAPPAQWDGVHVMQEK